MRTRIQELVYNITGTAFHDVVAVQERAVVDLLQQFTQHKAAQADAMLECARADNFQPLWHLEVGYLDTAVECALSYLLIKNRLRKRPVI